MEVIDTDICDVKLLIPTIFRDGRGYFMESWNKAKFDKVIGPTEFVQDNHSKSCKNTLRGLHFQVENTQGKLVRVINGAVFDVAVDMRCRSKTYGKWIGVYLTAENNHQLWIPKGFAHGFYVLSDIAEFAYKCTDYYNPKAEKTLIWNDQDVNICWPLNDEPILSTKDKYGLQLKDLEGFN